MAMKAAEKDKLKSIAGMLRMAGDGTRIRILCVIFRGGRSCVSEIADELGMSVPAVSHHLRMMANAGLIEPVRDGKNVCYALSATPMAEDIRRFVCKYK